jgi:hypothetical protein
MPFTEKNIGQIADAVNAGGKTLCEIFGLVIAAFQETEKKERDRRDGVHALKDLTGKKPRIGFSHIEGKPFDPPIFEFMHDGLYRIVEIEQ